MTEKYENPILKAVGDIFNKLIVGVAIITGIILILGFFKALYHIVMLLFGKPWPSDFPKIYGYLAIPFFLFVLWFLYGFGDQPGFLDFFRQRQAEAMKTYGR